MQRPANGEPLPKHRRSTGKSKSVHIHYIQADRLLEVCIGEGDAESVSGLKDRLAMSCGVSPARQLLSLSFDSFAALIKDKGDSGLMYDVAALTEELGEYFLCTCGKLHDVADEEGFKANGNRATANGSATNGRCGSTCGLTEPGRSGHRISETSYISIT
jgi:hypothetical protein